MKVKAGIISIGLLVLSAAMQSLAHATKDHKEAVTAFLDKRRPTFTGN